MNVRTTRNSGILTVSWQETHTASLKKAYQTSGIVFGGLFLTVVVFWTVAIAAGKGNAGAGAAFLSSVIVLGITVSFAVWSGFIETTGDVKGPTGIWFRKVFYDSQAYLFEDNTGECFIVVDRGVLSFARISRKTLRGFAIQSWAEYDQPAHKSWPVEHVLVADVGSGSTRIVAQHYGGRHELGELLSHLNKAFIEAAPVTEKSAARPPVQDKALPVRSPARSISDDVI